MTAFETGQDQRKMSPREKEATIVTKNDSPLMTLVSEDHELYDAMENFLLADPQREVPQLGEPLDFIERADSCKAENDRMRARANYETAVKIEIFRQNKPGAMKCLALADEVTDRNDKHSKYHETMLIDMDRVLRVAKEYYDSISTP